DQCAYPSPAPVGRTAAERPLFTARAPAIQPGSFVLIQCRRSGADRVGAATLQALWPVNPSRAVMAFKRASAAALMFTPKLSVISVIGSPGGCSVMRIR